MRLERQNILVLGSGPAGLSAANELSKHHKVEVISPETKSMDHSVYTTDKLLPAEISQLFFQEKHIKALPSVRVMTPSGTDFRVGTNGCRYFALDYPNMVEHVQEKLIDNGVQVTKLNASDLKTTIISDSPSGVKVNIGGGVKEYDKLVDATGWRSKISHTREDDFLTEYVYGATYKGNLENPDMILVYAISGGMCWANPSIIDNDSVDVVFSAYGPKKQFHNFLISAKKRLDKLTKFLSQKDGVHLNVDKPRNIYSGLIRAQPIAQPCYNSIYSVGEAAGMARPGTGDSIQRAIFSGKMLSESFFLSDSPASFYNKSRRLWRSDDILYSGMMERLSFQEKNQLGGTAEEVGKWLKTADSNKMFKEIERYVINGELSLSLLYKILNSSMMRGAFKKAITGMIKTKLGITKLPNHLPLPPV